MLGYIVPDKPELKMREFDLYGGYYCAVCRSIGKRYGQVPRLALSYDAVFLALLLSGLAEEKEETRIFRCPIRLSKKRLLVENSSAVDYAADILLLLAYYKLLDDLQDEGSLKAKAGIFAGKDIFKKLMKKHGEKGIILEEKIRELTVLEEDKCASMDHAAEPFALLMKNAFIPGDNIMNDILGREAQPEELKSIRSGLGQIGYHIGKWIYLIDAWDDIEDDLLSRAYNPLLYRFKYSEGEESEAGFRDRIRDRMEFTLVCSLEQASEACRELPLKKNRGIIENIIYFGLLRNTEHILQKGKLEQDESL